jgi:ribonuclease BN (tRNA processing enzyme)
MDRAEAGALRLVVLGVGDALSELHYSTSFALVAAGGDWLLFDCPHPARKIVREAAQSSGVDLAWPRLAGVVLTHLHADHCSGLEGLGAYWKYTRKQPPLPLLMGREVAEQFGRRSEADLYEPSVVRKRTPTDNGPFRLLAHPAEHGDMPAYSFRVEAGGRTLGLSGDTAFDPDLVRWLAAADLVIHEAGSDEPENAHHTPYAKLLTLPEEWRRKLRLVHCTDHFDLDASAIEPLRQGRAYDV